MKILILSMALYIFLFTEQRSHADQTKVSQFTKNVLSKNSDVDDAEIVLIERIANEIKNTLLKDSLNNKAVWVPIVDKKGQTLKSRKLSKYLQTKEIPNDLRSATYFSKDSSDEGIIYENLTLLPVKYLSSFQQNIYFSLAQKALSLVESSRIDFEQSDRIPTQIIQNILENLNVSLTILKNPKFGRKMEIDPLILQAYTFQREIITAVQLAVNAKLNADFPTKDLILQELTRIEADLEDIRGITHRIFEKEKQSFNNKTYNIEVSDETGKAYPWDQRFKYFALNRIPKYLENTYTAKNEHLSVDLLRTPFKLLPAQEQKRRQNIPRLALDIIKIEMLRIAGKAKTYSKIEAESLLKLIGSAVESQSRQSPFTKKRDEVLTKAYSEIQILQENASLQELAMKKAAHEIILNSVKEIHQLLLLQSAELRKLDSYNGQWEQLLPDVQEAIFKSVNEVYKSKYSALVNENNAPFHAALDMIQNDINLVREFGNKYHDLWRATTTRESRYMPIQDVDGMTYRLDQLDDYCNRYNIPGELRKHIGINREIKKAPDILSENILHLPNQYLSYENKRNSELGGVDALNAIKQIDWSQITNQVDAQTQLQITADGINANWKKRHPEQGKDAKYADKWADRGDEMNRQNLNAVQVMIDIIKEKQLELPPAIVVNTLAKMIKQLDRKVKMASKKSEVAERAEKARQTKDPSTTIGLCSALFN